MIPGPFGEVGAVSTAGGGTAITATAQRIVLPKKAKFIQLIPRNFAGATVLKWNKNPWLTVLKTADLFATAPTEYSDEAQDGSTATSVVLSSLGTLVQGDMLLVGAMWPFAGLECDVDAANGTTSDLAAHYWNGSAWADISPSDGTASGGATFAQDGSITWTPPTAWKIGLLGDIFGTEFARGWPDALFWVRLTVSAALDSSTTLDSMLAINRATDYAELPQGMWEEEAVLVGKGGIASITALTDAGTANLILNKKARNGGML